MNTDLFIKRPVTTTLVMFAVLLLGVFAFRVLPVNDLPNVDFPTITVSASLPGASPETMASSVATPLERRFSTVAGITSISSINALGSTNVTLQFELSRDIDAAAQDVQAAIAATQRDLPADMPAPPSYRKVNPADSPIFYLALSSPTLRLSEVDEVADTTIAQRISTLSGVAQVQVYGSQKYAVRVQLDPRALASRQIGIDEVAQSIRTGNSNAPTGTLYGNDKTYTIRSTGQLEDAAQFSPLIVAYRNGSPVRLDELGNVTDSVENDKQASWFRDDRAVVLAVFRQPGTNTVEVVDRIRSLLPQLRQQMPAAVKLDILFDRSQSIRESIHEVEFTLMITIALVVMVIFIFLRNISATLIPSLAVPMSVIGTFAAMYLFGFTLNNLSLMALTLAVGFVVDDAIVMLENIVRHMEMGKSPLQAALEGAREIKFTIISMTISLTAVFIPVLFMGGIVGRLLNEFAVTIMVAILISGFVSLTLTPMLGSRYLRSHAGERHGRLYMVFERFFDGLLHVYETSLRFVLRHRVATVAVSFLVLLATVELFRSIPKGFLPNEDIGQLRVFTEGAQGVSFDDMKRYQMMMNAVLLDNPYVDGFMSSIGGGGGVSAGNAGRAFVRLKPRGERPSSAEVANMLRPKLAQIPGLQSFVSEVQALNVGGQVSKSPYQFTLQSPDTEELYKAAPELEKKMRTLPGLLDVTSDLQIRNPQVRVDIDRDKASALGVTASQVEDGLFSAYGQRQISTILAPTNQYRVIMELKPEYQLDPAALSMLYIRSNKGQLVPLNAVASIRREIGPLTVAHLGQLPSVTLAFNIKEGVALGDAVDAVYAAAGQTLPDTVTTSFQGTAQAFQDSVKGLGILLLMAVLVIYIVLGVLYESFIHPITILSGLPSAGFGALLTLMIFKADLNLYGFVGVIMLVGIVKKNAIMMIDFALEAQRTEGKRPLDAIYEGAIVRFRPIMMTTAAALMGTLPIAIGYGAGGEARRPLGLAVVGGLLTSQVLTLYITPVIYYYLDNFETWWRGKFGKKSKKAQSGRRVAEETREPALAGSDD